MPELQADLFGDNVSSEDIHIEKAQPSFPTIQDLTDNERFQSMPSVRKAYTLGQYRNKLANHLVEIGEVKDEKQLNKALNRISGTLNKHMPSGNTLESLLDATVDRREIISEMSGLASTGRLLGRSAAIRNNFNQMQQAQAHKNDERFYVPGQNQVEDYVKKFDSTYQELESLRTDMEASIDEDKDLQGRDLISGNGINASTIMNSASRMAIDIPMAIGAGMVSGGAGTLAYYSLTSAARSDRELRGSKPEMSASERLNRAGVTGVAVGSAESIGFGFLTNGTRALKLTKVMNNVVPASARKIMGASMAEASTEFAQTYLEHFGHNVEALDDFITIMQDPKVAEEAMASALIGGIMGGGVRGGIEISTPAIDKIIQTDAYKNARVKIHKQLEKVDISKRVAEPISDLSDSIIKTSEIINQESKNLEELEIQRDAGQIVGEAIAEDATKRELNTPEEGGPGIEIDGRFEKSDILTSSEAREQGESSIVQDSDIDAKDFIPNNEGQNISEVIRDSIVDNGGIDIANSTHFKDSLQDVDGNPVFSPKFKATKKADGLSLDQHIEILAEKGIVPRDVNPDVIVDALKGTKTEFADARNSQPSLEDLEIMADQTPNAEFELEVEDALFFPDPDAKPDRIKKSTEQAEPVIDIPVKVPKEAMPVPFNIDNDPKIKRDVTRKVRSIAKLVENELGIPVRQGKFRHKALGIYKPGAKVVRTKLANDLQVIAHEVGHGLSDRFNLATNQDSSFDNELLPIGEKTSGKDYSTEDIREEGRAEFFREFLVNPVQAKKLAPKFHKALTEAISQDASTQAGVQKLSDAYADIVSQSASERVESTIVQEDEIKPKQTLKEQNLSRRIEVTDKLAALNELTKDVYGKEEINILKDPYRLARLGAGASDVANYFVESGIYDSSGKKISDGLLTVFDGMSNDQIKKFDTYLKSRRISVDLADRGITSGVQVKEAQESVQQLENANPEFTERAEQLKGFTDGLIEYSVREGVLTKEEADRILAKNTAYIPFARAYEKFGSKATGTAANPFQAIEGDTKDTLSGIAALENNVLMTVRAAANMKIYDALAQMAQVPGMGKFIEKVDSGGKGESVISFVRDGKRENYSINDPLVYDALVYSPEVSAISTGIVASMARKAALAVNRTAIITPPFVFKNLVRDTVAAGAQSKNNFIPVVDSIVGIFEVLGNTDFYQMFQRSGAGQATFTKMLSGEKPKVNKSKTALDYLLTPIRALEHIAQVTEEATRVADFKKTYKRMQKNGSSEAESIATAAFEARDLTIDFQKSGRTVQKLNAYVPFLNANVQGKIKTFQTLKTKKGLAGAALMIVAPEILLWSLLKDDDDFEEQPDHVKDNYWLIPGRSGEGGEKFWKVPKPQGYSWFSNKIRNSLNSLTGREADNLENLRGKLKEDLRSEASSVIPAFIKPILEVQANYSFFRDSSIINQYVKQLPVAEQYNSYTSEVAKTLGPKIGIAPIYFDHLVYGYTTNWGKAATTSMDATFLRNIEEVPSPDKESGKSTFAELSGLKSFLATNPNYGAVSIQSIFEMNEKLTGIKNAVRSRDEEGKKSLLEENKDLWSKRHIVQGAYRQIKTIGKKIKSIYEHETMSPDQKKKELRHHFDRMLEVSRKALDKK